MSARTPLLDELCERLRCLPGVGPRSARRMAMHLLQHDRDGGRHLAETLQRAMRDIGNCRRCRTFSEDDVCAVCADPKRDDKLLCVVETPSDMNALEAAGGWRGRYFVLLGRLSPIDGIGPEEIGADALQQRVAEGVAEIVLATSATVEGEATSIYLSQQLRGDGLRVSRIAHGVPLGSELDFIDGGTLSHALDQRQEME